MRSVTLSVLVIALFTLPTSSAQAPTDVTTSLQVTGLPAQLQDLAQNETKTVPFTVEYRVQGGFLCAQPATVPITITMSQGGQAAFLTPSLDTTEGTITIDAGPHQGASGTVTANLLVEVGEIDANASVPIQISAEAGAVSGCQPALPAASAEPVTTFANVTYTPPPEPTPEPPAESPGFETVALALAVAVGASLMRRKRN